MVKKEVKLMCAHHLEHAPDMRYRFTYVGADLR